VLDAKRANRFKKEFARAEKRGKNMDKLIEVMGMLMNEQPLLAKHHNHPLHGGEWEGKWECHIEPDWLLVYRIDKKKGQILFYRTGTHTDLF
jgi:mRNA interferase YafQ